MKHPQASHVNHFIGNFQENWYRVSTVFSLFPNDRNCDIGQRTKIARTPCRKRTGNPLFRAEKFGDLLTADHKVLHEAYESRKNHRYAVVVQDLTTRWLKSCPCKTPNLLWRRRRVYKSLSTATPKFFLFWQFCGVWQSLWRVILESLYIGNRTFVPTSWMCKRQTVGFMQFYWIWGSILRCGPTHGRYSRSWSLGIGSWSITFFCESTQKHGATERTKKQSNTSEDFGWTHVDYVTSNATLSRFDATSPQTQILLKVSLSCTFSKTMKQKSGWLRAEALPWDT